MIYRIVFSCLLLAASLSASSAEDSYDELLFEIYEEVVTADTTHSSGDTLAVANQLANRLVGEGFAPGDVTVVEFGGKGNLVARLRSQNPEAEPVLLLAHMDVVEADPADWSMDPFELHDVDGYYYARGTLDDKDEVAIHITNLIRMKREKVPLKRDVIVAITADEEGGPHNGARHLVENHRELVDAAFVINEGGGGIIKDGVYVANTVQAAEKVYQSYYLEVTNPGGHSSLPRKDNAIYQLSNALKKIEAHAFPVMLNATTRAYFEGQASIADEELSVRLRGLLMEPPDPASVQYFEDEPAINARLRTTCVATELLAGHAENALPQRARATVNCRVFPGVPVADIQLTLERVTADPEVCVTPVQVAFVSDASPLLDEVMTPVKLITESMWPQAVVIPTMSTGATDALWFRNAGIPVYGVSGIFSDIADNRAHGRDERVLKRSLYEGLEFLYRLTVSLVISEDMADPATKL